MGKRKKQDAEAPEAVAPEAHYETSPDLSIVLSLSLVAGGVATWPALQELMEGRATPVRAATVFLLTTLVALVGFGAVALLFHAFGATDEDGDESAADGAPDGEYGSLEPVVGGFDFERDIDAALAPTEGLVHGQTVGR